MSDEKEKEKDTSNNKSFVEQLGSWVTIGTSLIAALGGLATAGPWGIVIGGIAGLAGILGINLGIRKYNDYIDRRDLRRAGADSGNTAVDLRNQIDDVNDNLDKLQKKHGKKGENKTVS